MFRDEFGCGDGCGVCGGVASGENSHGKAYGNPIPILTSLWYDIESQIISTSMIPHSLDFVGHTIKICRSNLIGRWVSLLGVGSAIGPGWHIGMDFDNAYSNYWDKTFTVSLTV